jgi:hypothetical protein
MSSSAAASKGAQSPRERDPHFMQTSPSAPRPSIIERVTSSGFMIACFLALPSWRGPFCGPVHFVHSLPIFVFYQYKSVAVREYWTKPR